MKNSQIVDYSIETKCPNSAFYRSKAETQLLSSPIFPCCCLFVRKLMSPTNHHTSAWIFEKICVSILKYLIQILLHQLMKAFADGRNLVDILTQDGFVTKKGRSDPSQEGCGSINFIYFTLWWAYLALAWFSFQNLAQGVTFILRHGPNLSDPSSLASP